MAAEGSEVMAESCTAQTWRCLNAWAGVMPSCLTSTQKQVLYCAGSTSTQSCMLEGVKARSSHDSGTDARMCLASVDLVVDVCVSLSP